MTSTTAALLVEIGEQGAKLGQPIETAAFAEHWTTPGMNAGILSERARAFLITTIPF